MQDDIHQHSILHMENIQKVTNKTIQKNLSANEQCRPAAPWAALPLRDPEPKRRAMGEHLWQKCRQQLKCALKLEGLVMENVIIYYEFMVNHVFNNIIICLVQWLSTIIRINPNYYAKNQTTPATKTEMLFKSACPASGPGMDSKSTGSCCPNVVGETKQMDPWITPWKINMVHLQITHLERNMDLPNLHDTVPC